jgi:AraC-like DNA-binding protein
MLGSRPHRWFTDVMAHLDELRRRIARLAAGTPRPVWIEGMTVFSSPRVTEPLGTLSEPAFVLVAQGARRSVIADRIFDYHAGQYLVVTVDLPLTSHITQATRTEPFLSFRLPLEPALIAQLLLETGPTVARRHDGPGIGIGDAHDKLLDPVVRLLRLLDEPRDVPVLAAGLRREIHWRLLNGPQGALVRQLGLDNSQCAHVARAIGWIENHYDRVLRIDELAKHVGMSVASLNRHFRAVTGMSPLQYQKQLRLQKARIQLIAAPHDVAAVGYAVGYRNPSQFSREYRRMFGAPPGQDAVRLQSVTTVQD